MNLRGQGWRGTCRVNSSVLGPHRQIYAQIELVRFLFSSPFPLFNFQTRHHCPMLDTHCSTLAAHPSPPPRCTWLPCPLHNPWPLSTLCLGLVPAYSVRGDNTTSTPRPQPWRPLALSVPSGHVLGPQRPYRPDHWWPHRPNPCHAHSFAIGGRRKEEGGRRREELKIEKVRKNSDFL
jgi:hypothetical protein